MFELETILKVYAGSEPDKDISISYESAVEIAENFKTIRTALRRITSLDEKNVAKYAQQIARDALARTHA